jgi:hypothetical protein
VDEIDHTVGQRILIEGLNAHKAYLMINLVLGSNLMRIYNLPGAALLHDPDPEIEAFFRAYGVNEFYYLSDRNQSLGAWVTAGLRAYLLLLNCPDMDDFIQWKDGDFYPGRGVYDWLLRSSGMGTVDRYTLLFFSMLATSFNYDDYVSGLFGSGRFPVLVQAERQFIPESILFRNALAKGMEVCQRGGGPTSFSMFRFSGHEEMYCNTFRFSREQFDFIWQHHREESVRMGGDFITSRVNGEVRKNDIADAKLAFGVATDITRESLCERFGWDPKTPIVILMANTLTDGVFTNRWKLFRDNFTFIDRTVQAMPGISTVNWLIKSHPSDVKNQVKVTGRDVYEKWAGDCPHVQFYPNEWGGRPLFGIVDAVITSHGSPGVEYSCFGIPCVLGGESLYSGRGFTHEPQTRDEYFELLKNIHTLSPLNREQVERAKAFAYLYLILSRVEVEFLPEVSVHAGYDDERYLMDAAAQLTKIDPLRHKLGRMLRIQIEDGHRHLLNYDWVGLDALHDRPRPRSAGKEGGVALWE